MKIDDKGEFLWVTCFRPVQVSRFLFVCFICSFLFYFDFAFHFLFSYSTKFCLLLPNDKKCAVLHLSTSQAAALDNFVINAAHESSQKMLTLLIYISLLAIMTTEFLFCAIATINPVTPLGTLETALIISLPICILCVTAVIFVMIWQKRRLKRYRNDIEGSVASSDPLIAPGQTLKDLLDHTTSGSGSGKL